VQEWLNLGSTHIAPSWRVNPHNGDHYSAYNKPLAVIDWLTHAPPEEEWLIILDADMILRAPFVCEGVAFEGDASPQQPPAYRVKCARGQPIAAHFGCVLLRWLRCSFADRSVLAMRGARTALLSQGARCAAT
jgi:hypothetical protein